MAISLGSPGVSPAPATNTTAQILLDTPPAFTYDAAGNMTSDGKNLYAWNDEDRLASVTPVFPRQGDLKLTYTYDYQGRRVYTDRYTFNALTGGGGTGGGGIPAAGGSWAAASRTFYQYQGWNVVAATLSGTAVPQPGSSTTTTYAWGVDLSGSLHGAGGVGGLLAMRDSAGALAEYHYDFNGNVVGLADPASPQLLAEYTYDPFGKRLSATGPLAAANPFRFSTKIEEETGWNYYGYRFFAPEIGRWPNRDPIGERGGVNLLLMLENNAITSVDFLGLSETITPHENAAYSPKEDCGSCKIQFKFTRARLWEARQGSFTDNGAEVQLEAKVTNPVDCCCEETKMIQIVRYYVERNGVREVKDPGEATKRKRAGMGNNLPAGMPLDNAGYYVDTYPKGFDSPYYSDAGDTDEDASDDGTGSGSTGCIPGTTERPCGIRDRPDKRARFNYGKEFTTCIVCLNKGKVLGCIKWGFYSGINKPVQWNEDTANSASCGPPDYVKSAIQRWDFIYKEKNSGIEF